GEEEAWTAAMALKQKSADLQAAAALSKFSADFPQSSHGIACKIEEGVCWFSMGRAAQVLHRMTPTAQERFDKASSLFKSVTSDHASTPEASRASFMQGQVHLFAGQLELAEADYSAMLERFTMDKSYVGKTLLQRATVRRQLLRSKDAIADLRRWVKEIGAPADQLQKTNSELARALLLDKQAPLYQAETWFSGDPAPLELQSGNVVALYFFATWCPNCSAELPFLLDLERRFAPKGVRFIGVVDHQQGQTPEVVRNYLTEKRIPFTVFQDNHATSTAYKVDTIPTVALIDRNGNLRLIEKPSMVADSTLDMLVREGLEPAGK
ncbi:MAG: redoxin domain-containing protein, partial [Planctomycetota bacterium]